MRQYAGDGSRWIKKRYAPPGYAGGAGEPALLETVKGARAGGSVRLAPELVVAACLAGLIAQTIPLAKDWDAIRQGRNDFPAFYLCPRLLGTGQLYDQAAFQAEQARILGRTNANIQFVRLPYMAVMLAPLSRLPFSAAYALWQALSIAALAAFSWLWPGRRALTAVILCWYPAVGANLANAQDVAFLLLAVAIVAALVRRGRDVGAGLVLALCAAKIHICLFLPVLIVGRRTWRLGAGFAAGLTVLLAVSFAAAGMSWPAAWLQAIGSPLVSPHIAKSSLLAFAAEAVHGPALWAIAGGLILAVGAGVFIVSRRSSFLLGLGAALAGGLLVAFHVYAQDYLLALPLILTCVSELRRERGAG
jgi:hypothetical protein